MKKPLFIGLGHRKRTGKDTFASMLSGELMYNKGLRVAIRSFARPLKVQAAQIYGWAGLEVPEVYEQKATEYLREVTLPAIGKTPREIWIEFGMKMREIYPDTWLDILLKDENNIDYDVIIIPDTRFPNECTGILDHNGLLYRILNDRVEVSDDRADNALVGHEAVWTGDINNNSTLRGLADQARNLADEIHGVL